MDSLYRTGKATALEIQGGMSSPPSYTAVRTLLTILEQKGHITHYEDGPRYVYEPTVPRKEMAVTTLKGVLQTFFDGSIERAVATLLDQRETEISDEQLERLMEMIAKARKEGR